MSTRPVAAPFPGGALGDHDIVGLAEPVAVNMDRIMANLAQAGRHHGGQRVVDQKRHRPGRRASSRSWTAAAA